ncbi:MAG: class I SAM-dependent methyltransferase [Parvibaculaceae bacterium]
MSTGNSIPPSVSPAAAKFLERAYGLASPEESLSLYQDWASSYDDTMLTGLGYISPTRLAGLVGRVTQDRRAHILDVGCGTGLLTLELARRGFSRFEGVDMSAEMLNTARSRGLFGRLHQADLTRRLPLSDGTYDVVACVGTFTHGHIGAECLDELLRVLKAGGVIVCTVHRDVWKESRFEQRFQALAAQSRLERLVFEPGIFYESAREPDGWYCAWRKTGG